MSEQGTFNLIDEPWILVRFVDGHVAEISLSDLFVQWDVIADILGDIPTQSFALYRLMLAIMYRSAAHAGTPIAQAEDWEDFWEDSASFTAAINAYLANWHSRFDLLSSADPFFQVAGLHSSKNEVSSLERIVLDSPLGGHFANRTASGLSQIAWSEAARWLIHAHAFDTSGIKTGAVGDPRVKGGKGYGIGTGWAGQLGGVLLKGEHLYQTLMLNLIPLELDNSPLARIQVEKDLPPWERVPLGPGVRDGNETLDPTGPVDLFTWQSRRIRLLGSTAGATGVVLAQGDRMSPQNRQRFEPMSVWRYSIPQSKKLQTHVYMPRVLESTRSFWRGLSAVIPQISNAGTTDAFDKKSKVQASLSPAVLTWYSQLVNRYIISPQSIVPIEVFGLEYGVQSSVIENSLHDSLYFPANLLSDGADAARTNLVQALALSEGTANVLGRFARNLAIASGGTDGDGEASKIRTMFFFEAEHLFRHWIMQPNQSASESLVQWQHELRTLADRLISHAVASVPASAAVGHQGFGGSWMDLGKAESQVLSGLRRVLPDAFEPVLSDSKNSSSEGKNE